jgi:hypothetical protein
MAYITAFARTQHLHGMLQWFGWRCYEILDVLPLHSLSKWKFIVWEYKLMIWMFSVGHASSLVLFCTVSSIICLVECFAHGLLLMWLFLCFECSRLQTGR